MHERKFDPGKKAHLNKEERLKMLPPDDIWKFINHPEPQLIVDIGAGTGYITRALAQQKPGAKVLALDIEPLMIEEMHEQLNNSARICPVLMEPNKIPMTDKRVDVLWMVNLFHELDEPDKMLYEIRRVLKPEGKLLIIDWDKHAESMEEGPPEHHRIPREEIEAEVKGAGFSVLDNKLYENHIALVASPNT